MIVALPSNHWPIAAALAVEGFDVVHVDQHIRDHLGELDPPISATPVLANMAGSGRLSDKLDERRSDMFRWRYAPGVVVDALDEYRVVVSQHDREGVVRPVTHDVWDDCAERNPELRRMSAVLRRLLPAPGFALEGDTVIIGVDTDEQAALLPAGVRVVALKGSVPAWAIGCADLHVIDDGSQYEQEVAALAVVRGEPVPA